jgi:fatty acid desaturase
MTTLQRQQHNRIAHLSGEDLETLGRELDAVRQQVLDSRGERDADYIRNVIDFQRKLELGSRAVLLSSLFPPARLAGTVGLSVAKIVENMEIGHNVMHGQWDNRLLHFMTGNLSFQIEHHLFQDLPSNRYQEIAPKVQELFERYGLTYVSGPMVKQVGSAWKKVFRLSPPNDVLRKATAAVKPASLNELIFGPAAQVDATAA